MPSVTADNMAVPWFPRGDEDLNTSQCVPGEKIKKTAWVTYGLHSSSHMNSLLPPSGLRESWRWGFWLRGLLGIPTYNLRRKRERKKMVDKEERVEGEKERRRVCRGKKKKEKQTLEGSKIQKWVSETLNLTRCIKAMEEREEAKPDKRAASRKKREMGWWAADVTKEIVLETSHQQIHKTMVPSWAKHTISGIMQCDTLSFSLSLYYEPQKKMFRLTLTSSIHFGAF